MLEIIFEWSLQVAIKFSHMLPHHNSTTFSINYSYFCYVLCSLSDHSLYIIVVNACVLLLVMILGELFLKVMIYLDYS